MWVTAWRGVAWRDCAELFGWEFELIATILYIIGGIRK